MMSLNMMSVWIENAVLVSKDGCNHMFSLKNHKKSHENGVVRGLFGYKGKLFSRMFFYHFVEQNKLYRMCEIQFGPILR